MTKVDVALWLIGIGIFAWGTCFGWLVRKLFMEYNPTKTSKLRIDFQDAVEKLPVENKYVK